jgi:hypothetical protein
MRNHTQIAHVSSGMWRQSRTRVTTIATLLLLAGCAHTSPNATPAATQNSGVQGRTTIDGGCPVIRADTPCPDRPLTARITVIRDGSDTTILATITTNADGQFRIPLPPGTYLLRPDNLAGARYPTAQPVTVTIRPGEFTQVTIAFDSGIR